MATTATKASDGESEDGQDGRALVDPAIFALILEMGDVVDSAIFAQIVGMDEKDPDDPLADPRAFSRSIVYDFFKQALEKFEEMEKGVPISTGSQIRKERTLGGLSGLGHYLKGSSATLGINKVRDSCEKIQHYGAGKDETGVHDEPEETCWRNVDLAIKQAKAEYMEARQALQQFYIDMDEHDKSLITEGDRVAV